LYALVVLADLFIVFHLKEIVEFTSECEPQNFFQPPEKRRKDVLAMSVHPSVQPQQHPPSSRPNNGTEFIIITNDIKARNSVGRFDFGLVRII
jgi:hypothetical protein